MAPSRLELLRGFVASRPDDPFPRYGMAIELRSAGDLEGAAREFGVLLERSPDYLPAYLHGGGALAALGRRQEARVTFERGIALAAKVGDTKTLGELESALGAL